MVSSIIRLLFVAFMLLISNASSESTTNELHDRDRIKTPNAPSITDVFIRDFDHEHATSSALSCQTRKHHSPGKAYVSSARDMIPWEGLCTQITAGNGCTQLAINDQAIIEICGMFLKLYEIWRLTISQSGETYKAVPCVILRSAVGVIIGQCVVFDKVAGTFVDLGITVKVKSRW